MKKISYSELVGAIKKVGVERGDIVHVQSDLAWIGPVDCGPSKVEILDFYYAAFQECIGETGTLSVATFFYDYGREGIPFDRKTTPSQTGVFSEYVRNKAGAVRSRHPIVSIALVGAEAEAIGNTPHFSGYGMVSPWAELSRRNAKILSLGLGWKRGGGVSFIHHCEAMYGVPYSYTKLFTVPVLDGGEKVEGEFSLNVLYQDLGVRYDTAPFRKKLLDEGLAHYIPLGRGGIFCSPAQNMFGRAMEELSKSRHAFLKAHPAYTAGCIPMDGPLNASR